MPAIVHRLCLLVVGLLAAGLLAVPAPVLAAQVAAAPVTPVAAPAASDSARSPVAAAPAAYKKRKNRYSTPLGASFSNPLNGRGRDILRIVLNSIKASAKGSTIRLVVWNYDEPAMTRALIAAKRRGVTVQVVVAESVANRNFRNLRNFLNKNRNDDNFAMRCHNACRSNRFVMHSKIFLFSKVGKRKNISMFGSTNLTVAAGNRQWNDQITTDNQALYRYFVKTFDEYAADKPVATPRDTFNNGRFQVSLFPVPENNPVREAFAKVGCRHPKQIGRTTVRIAIAGWFDQFGVRIAQQVRRMWDRGCDVRIITTLTGRKIHQILRKRSGRGRIPIRTVTIDKNRDGEPDRYLHMKAVSIQGTYDGVPNTSVVFTGSPNWSGEARASDEVFIVVRRAKTLAKRYRAFIDYLFGSRIAHRGAAPVERPLTDDRARARSGYELD